ncbi:MAG: FAD-dependent oxidoreductase [Gemmatimonadota bacterium]|nr:FAD-dependent oxidoreductase [Gemmatimonadota bacterium]
MGGQQKTPEGPDLAEGVQLAELLDGEPFAGRVGDDAVVLVRRGSEVFAVGGRCTHYGGALADGLVEGDTIRCPLHHACFSLRTGEPAGPAFNPLPRWDVEVRDGVVRLGEKRTEPPLSSRGRRTSGPGTVVIVGAGAAGSAAAETLRREGHEGDIVMIDPQAEAPYDRPNLSKDYLAGNAPEAWVPLRGEGFYEENGVERIEGTVRDLDPDERRVQLEGGETRAFDALLLATGALAVRPPIEGLDSPHAHTLRSLADCRALIAGLEGAERAVVIGSSFIGMEGAASLRARELEVTVVSLEAVPFERTLGPAIGERLRALHEEHGVAFRPERRVQRIDDEGVTLDDGSVLPADIVLVGVGARPDVDLAERAGLDVDDGVVVDRYLRTSADAVWAAGDIARWPDPRWGSARIEHWEVAQRQGRTAARNILGVEEPFTDVPFFWTHQYDLRVSYVGHANEWDEAVVDGDPAEDCAVRFLSGGRTLAVATIGRDRESLEAEVEFERELAG